MVYEIISKPNIEAGTIRSRLPGRCNGHSFVRDRKELLLRLSEAARRSSLILILWDLNDRNLDISRVLAKALGLGLIRADGDDSGFCLPEGATAFVDTASAVYGYYLESGPQSIVVLTHLPSVREFALRAFLLPYIQEKDPAAPVDPVRSSEPPNPADAARAADESAAVRAVPAEPETAVEPEPVSEPASEPADHPEPPAPAPETSEIPDRFAWEPESEPIPPFPDVAETRRRRTRMFTKLLCALLALSVVFSGSYFAIEFVTDKVAAQKIYEEMRALKNKTGDVPAGALPEFGGLYEANRAVAGWIEIPGTAVDYPVLVPPAGQSRYYLDRLPDGRRSKYGTPFFPAGFRAMDYYRNTVITGRNPGDGRMFSDLQQYLDKEFFALHLTARMSTLYEDNRWVFFAALLSDADDSFDPTETSFFDDEAFSAFLEELRARAPVRANLDVNENDTLLTLVTEHAELRDTRLVLVARKVRYGEILDGVNVSYNPRASLPDSALRPENSRSLPVSLRLALQKGGSDDSDSDFDSDPESDAVPTVRIPSDTDGPSEEVSSETASADSSAESAASSSDSSRASAPLAPSSSPTSSAVSRSPSSSRGSSATPSVSSDKPASSRPSASSSVSSAPASSQKPASSAPSSSAPSSSAPSAPAPALPALKVTNQFNGRTVTGTAEEILAQVVEAEMGSGFHIEALKAQTVAAYTWILNNGSSPTVPMKTAGARAKEAVRAVLGQTVRYGNARANVFYFATSAGKTARSEDVWVTPYPYLISVDSSVDKNVSGFQTFRTYKRDDVARWISKEYRLDVSGTDPEKWFKVTYDANGLYAKTVTLGGKLSVKGPDIRSTLFKTANVGSGNELRSHAFQISYNAASETFRFTVYGYGHGVGMSQTGANLYAQKGWTYLQILEHYFPGTKVGPDA